MSSLLGIIEKGDNMNVLVVGAGISGSTVARKLAEKGHFVTVIDEKSHVAGNCYDFFDHNGICVHKYGTHIFHTDIKEAWDFLSRFTQWFPYQHKVVALIDGQLVPIPFNLNSIEKIFPYSMARLLEEKLLSHFGFNVKVPILQLRNTGDKDLLFLADFIYEKVFLHYTLKQWGMKPEELDPMVTGRVPVYISRDDRYFQNRYQGIPLQGYTSVIEKILDHKNIALQLSTPFEHRMLSHFDHVYHTGPIDEFFNYELGELPYRSLRFDFLTFDRPYFQSNSVVNYPCNYDFTRIGEYKYFLNQDTRNTVVSYEYPEIFVRGDNERYYPIPSSSNKILYEKYFRKASQISEKVTFLGRLGDYKYYDMDKAVSRALSVA